MNQKSGNEFWIDEQGVRIPYGRVTKLERMMEAKSAQIVKKSRAMGESLVKLKEEFKSISTEVYEAYMADKEVKPSYKGNFTWYNFDRSIKIENAVSEAIKFDDMGIQAAKEKLDLFLQKNIDAKLDFLKELIMDAFSTASGKLDTGKVLSLLKYKTKIKDGLYLDAMSLVEQAIRRPSSKVYHRVAEKDANGEYKYVELNFSSI
jgi:hypothetical protein